MRVHSTFYFRTLITLSCVTWSTTEKPSIMAPPGKNVSLPFELPNNTTFEFVRIKKDGLAKYVYCYRDGKEEEPPVVEQTYWGQMARVDNKFILKNVSSQDNGTYELSYEDETGEHNFTFTLNVLNEVFTLSDQYSTPPAVSAAPTASSTTLLAEVDQSGDQWTMGKKVGVGVGIVLLIAVAAAVIYCMYRRLHKRCRGAKDPEAAAHSPTPPASSGDEDEDENFL